MERCNLEGGFQWIAIAGVSLTSRPESWVSEQGDSANVITEQDYLEMLSGSCFTTSQSN